MILGNFEQNEHKGSFDIFQVRMSLKVDLISKGYSPLFPFSFLRDHVLENKKVKQTQKQKIIIFKIF